MKKWLIVLSLLFLYGCAPAQKPTMVPVDTPAAEEQGQIQSDGASQEYEKYDIFSYEDLGDNKWKITNNSDETIPSVSFHLTYYDADDVLVDNTACSPEAALLPGQSAILEFYAEQDYPISRITSYCYNLPENSDINGESVTVDVITGSYEILT